MAPTGSSFSWVAPAIGRHDGSEAAEARKRLK